MSFCFKAEPAWPKLSWIATWKRGERVRVRHGSRVETCDDWFGEIVWSGPYDAAQFHRTDLAYGSGCRAVDGALEFVSSGMTTDRLNWAVVDNTFYVSNSLVCLLSDLAAELAPAYTRYGADFQTIVNGYNDCVNRVATSVGDIRLTYYRNVRWSGAKLAEVEKPSLSRDLSSYNRYRDFLEGALVAIGDNMRDSGRRFPYEFQGTIFVGIRLADRDCSGKEGWPDGSDHLHECAGRC